MKGSHWNVNDLTPSSAVNESAALAQQEQP